MSNASAWLRLIYGLCLLGATLNHVATLMEHGLLWDYGGVPLASCIFWTSLTFLDPLAALLLFLKPRIGLLLALTIIVIDVAHNTWLGLHLGLSAGWMYYSQLAFLLFVSMTIWTAWRGAPRVEQSPV